MTDNSALDESQNDEAVRPVGLAVSDRSGLIATGSRKPRFSWQIEAKRSGVLLLGYELQLSDDASFADLAVSTGFLQHEYPHSTVWPGSPLESRQVVWARVRQRTDVGVTEWSEPLRVEGALFAPHDWIARPISPHGNSGAIGPGPVSLLRRPFHIDKPVESARLYVTALGMQSCWLNGAEVSEDMFEPGWTAYRERLLYATYDVADKLRVGPNVLSAAVADGWWRGKLTWTNRRGVYGDTTALLAQLEIVFVDGSRALVVTDENWRGGTGLWRAADLYDGCDIDTASEPVGWRDHPFDDSGWSGVDLLALPPGLAQRSVPPVRIVERLTPSLVRKNIIKVDCGQNLTGHLRLIGSAAGHARIVVRHAEVLEVDGGLHTAALRGARATDSYTIGAGPFDLQPAFTYHGFRYAEIAIEGNAVINSVEACVVSSDLREIGRFSCSDPRINQLVSNVRWSQRGNFITLPTDCPQRDERMGWTGDIQVFAPTACANFDTQSFLESWLEDLAIEQRADGQVPSTVPNVIHGHPYEYGGVGWADAATLVPWALYEAYGDTQVLGRQFASMCAWVDWASTRLNADGVWVGDFHLGDWLDPGAPPDRPEEATTDRDFIASAYLAYSARRLAQMSLALDRSQASAGFAALARRVGEATWRRWRDAAMKTQAGCAIAIAFGIAPEAEQARVGASLAALVQAGEGRIATGFLGTPLVLPALTRTGQHDAAFALLLNERSPGWLNQVRNGATTMWERWDAITPEGGIHDGAMAADDADSMMSFNHYAYGAVGAWLYRHLAGLAPDDLDQPGSRPGYRRIRFQPQPGGGIVHAGAAIDTAFGLAAIDWAIGPEGMNVRLRVPPGATATLAAPDGWAVPKNRANAVIGSGETRFLLSRKK